MVTYNFTGFSMESGVFVGSSICRAWSRCLASRLNDDDGFFSAPECARCFRNVSKISSPAPTQTAYNGHRQHANTGVGKGRDFFSLNSQERMLSEALWEEDQREVVRPTGGGGYSRCRRHHGERTEVWLSV